MLNRPVAIGAAPAPALGGDCGVLVTSWATFMPGVSQERIPDVGFVDSVATQKNLHDYLGQPLLINFWGTWCPPCVKEIPSLDRLVSKLEAKGVHVLAPAWEKRGGLDDVRAFLTKHRVNNLKAQIDADGQMAKAFSVHRFPSTVLVDAQGRRRGTFVGGVNWDEPRVLDTVLSSLK
ncbi:TlpA disulfide reductase family protein [Magnetovibrio sp. PR-2]|uniref:TlpA family protein disulfide reductase n=1 Tax=Magnetovibrio sp. PR-2 TaxID=3120356 RepID=UPI002FCE4EF6